MSAPWRIRIGVGAARGAYALGRKNCFARKILSLSQFFVPFILTPLLFVDETGSTTAVSDISLIDPISGVKQIVTDIVCGTRPPEITSLRAIPNTLWPPNHKMASVSVTVSASDVCDPSPICRVSAINSNEPVNGLGDGDTQPDWKLIENLVVNLRAERSGKGNGRTYTLTIECTNTHKNTSQKTITVTVPKNQK
jgi:hypothetical protein